MAGESSFSRTYGDVLSLSGDQIRPVIADVVTSRYPTLLIMNNAFGVKELVAGGIEMARPILKELINSQSYTDMGTLTIERGASLTRVWGVWKQKSAPVVVSGLDMIQNNGPEMVGDLFLARAENAFLSLGERIGGSTAGIHSDGTESTVLQLAGLQSWVSTTTTSGTIGRLARTNSWWQNIAVDIANDFSASGLSSMRSLALRIGRGTEKPHLVVFNRLTFQNFLTAHTATINYNIPQPPSVAASAVMDLGVPAISWFGMAVVQDDFVPANRGYMLNLRHFHLIVQRDRDMVLGDFLSPVDGDYIAAHVFWAGELLCTSLRAQGVLQNGDTD